MSGIPISKINPEFRLYLDLLFYTDRKDLNIDKFKNLLIENYNINYKYFIYRLEKSSEIFWSSEVWYDKISFLLSINDKKIRKNINSFFEKRIFNLIRKKHKIDQTVDVEYIQFIELIKFKSKNNESFNNIIQEILKLSSYIKFKKLYDFIQSTIPYVFKSFDDVVEIYIDSILDLKYSRNIEFLDYLNIRGHLIDKKHYNYIFNKILEKKNSTNKKTKLLLLKVIRNNNIIDFIKNNYSKEMDDFFEQLITSCYYTDYEKDHYKNTKALIEINPKFADLILKEFSDLLFIEEFEHNRAKLDKLLKLNRFVPEITIKKIVGVLIKNNRKKEIGYLVKLYPELKKITTLI